MQALLDRIAATIHEGGTWCTVEKGHRLAALVLALRPSTVVEIGVWMGGSAIPMAMALKHNEFGILWAIDPWDKRASMDGMDPVNRNWWGNIDHEAAYQVFCERVKKHDLSSFVNIVRKNSSDYESIPPAIGLLHIDGNHGDQAIQDVRRYAPMVNVGGFCVLDDIGWQGGSVQKAADDLLSQGFVKLYELGTGAVFQKRFRVPA